LGTSQGDLDRLAAELRGLAGELAQLAGVTDEELAGGSPPLSWLFLGFVAWLGVQIGAAGLAGVLILRRPA
jgi:hypothetical protein